MQVIGRHDNLKAVKKILFLALFWGFFVSGTFGQEPPLNRDKVAADIKKMLSGLSFDTMDSMGVTIQFGKVDGEKRGFINQLLLEYLTKQSRWSVGAENGGILHLEQFDSRIVYAQSPSGWLGWQGKLQRRHQLFLQGFLENENGNILKTWNFDTVLTDTIPENIVQRLENDPYLFTKGSYSEPGSWKKVIEPVMVTAALATLVFLFFTIRS